MNLSDGEGRQSDGDLPDPMELFERMQRLAEASSAAGFAEEGDDEELPDPAELFRQMEQYRIDHQDDDLPDPLELFQQMERYRLDHQDDDLPDPLELFQQMQRAGQGAPASLGEEHLAPDQPESAAPLPYIPDPDTVTYRKESPSLQEQPLGGWEEESFPYFSDEPPLGFHEEPLLDGNEVQDSDLPYIPAPTDPPLAPPEPPELPPATLFQRLKARFTRGKDKLFDAEQPDPVVPPFDEEPRAHSEFQVEPAQPFDVEAEPQRIPTPEELFRQLQAEREEAALNFEFGLEAPPLPTPEELFRRLKDEEEQALSEGNPSGLPELPDLDALKAELEAEERARLDPDLLGDLAGPERFVDTVSDSMFAGSGFPSFFETWDTEPGQTPDGGAPPSERRPPAEAGQRPKIDPARTGSSDEAGGATSVSEERERPGRQLPRPTAEAGNDPSTHPSDRHPSTPTPRSQRPDGAQPSPVARQTPQESGGPPSRLSAASSRPDSASSPTGTVRVDPERLAEAAVVGQYRPTPRPSGESSAGSFTHQLASSGKKSVFKRFSRHKLAIFTRQLAVMLKAGIQLHMAISFAAESDPEMEPLLNEVMRKVESGYTFSVALSETSRTFDQVYVGLIKAGEASGRLHEILERLADVLEREVELRKKVVSVITYPLILLLVCFLGTIGFIFFVLPTITPLFEDLAVELPLPTRILLSLREVLLPGVVAALAAGTAFYLLRDKIGDYVRSKPDLERQVAALPFYLPVLGGVYDKIVTARVLYSLSIMLEVGITLGQALLRAGTSAGNALVAFRLERARADLVDGVGVTDCFRLNGLFNASALHLIAAGEESAKLPEMFNFIAHLFDDEVEQSLRTASSVLEPLIMVIMGLVVGFVVISAALPTIQLLQNF